MNGTDTLSATPAEHTVEVRIDIACPGCEYNLRGLPGPVVDCPECGLTSDVAVLATRQWTKPWYRAPGFNTLVWPAACAWIWFCVVLLLPIIGADINSDILLVLGACTLGLAIWTGLMYRAYKVFDSTTGIWLALLMHVLVAGFLFGIFGLIVTVILGIIALIDEVDDHADDILSVVIGIFAFVCFVFVLWVCRRIERAIAGACIRHHLRRRPTV